MGYEIDVGLHRRQPDGPGLGKEVLVVGHARCMSSIRRSIQVSDLLARKGPLGVRAVAQQLSLPLGSVHRLLLDLADESVVERTADGDWELSYRLLRDHRPAARAARSSRAWRGPSAERIAEATGRR